jgi:hypothetical protein
MISPSILTAHSTSSCLLNIFSFIWGSSFVSLFALSSLSLSRGDASVLHRRLHASSFAPALSGHLAADLFIVAAAYDIGLKAFASGRTKFAENAGSPLLIFSNLRGILVGLWIPYIAAVILQYKTLEWLSISTQKGAQTTFASHMLFNVTERYARSSNEVIELAIGGFSAPEGSHLAKSIFLVLPEEHFHEQLCAATLWPIALLIVYRIVLLVCSFVSVRFWRMSESTLKCHVCGIRVCTSLEHKSTDSRSRGGLSSTSLSTSRRQRLCQEYLCGSFDFLKCCSKSARGRLGLCFCANSDSLLMWLLIFFFCVSMIWRIKVSPSVDIIRFTSRFVENIYYDSLFTSFMAHFPSFALGLFAARSTAKRDFGFVTTLISRFMWFTVSIGLILFIAYDASAWLYFVEGGLRSIALALYHPLFSTCCAIFIALSHRSITFTNYSALVIQFFTLTCRLFATHLPSKRLYADKSDNDEDEEDDLSSLRDREHQQRLLNVSNDCYHINRTIFAAWCFILPITMYLCLFTVGSISSSEAAISTLIIITLQAISYSLLVAILIRVIINRLALRNGTFQVFDVVNKARYLSFLRGGKKVAIDEPNLNVQHNSSVSVTSTSQLSGRRRFRQKIDMNIDAWIMGEDAREKSEHSENGEQSSIIGRDIDLEIEEDEYDNDDETSVINLSSNLGRDTKIEGGGIGREKNGGETEEIEFISGRTVEDEEKDTDENEVDMGEKEDEEEEEEEMEEENDKTRSKPLMFGGLLESEAIRAQQVADLIVTRVRMEVSDASFLSPTSESLLFPAEAVANTSGAIALGALGAAGRVLRSARFALDRLKRATNLFNRRGESRPIPRQGFQWTTHQPVFVSDDDDGESGTNGKNDDGDFDGPDAMSPSERIKSQKQNTILKAATQMQRSALALALQWKDGFPLESAPSDATLLRVLQLVQDQILADVNKLQSGDSPITDYSE